MLENDGKTNLGKVYLVGAGPGDPGLMTCKAVDCLRKADTVVYDRLLGSSILDYVRPGAELIFAGKSPNAHTLKQSEINQLLGDRAKEGKMVVRLKGGDPFVFGRGGEEAEHLVKQGIQFVVVPGISSSVAVPAYAGIPVTHRKTASSFVVVTGHEDPDKELSSIHWSGLAVGADTIVFLMAMANLERIVARLIAAGRSPSTPIAVIKEGTRPEQKVITGNLETIAGLVKSHSMGPPAIVVIGNVVNLRSKLQWFDNRPLFAKAVLVTRARHQASQLSRLLIDHGAIPVEAPAICINQVADMAGLDQAITKLEDYHWLVFTSVNGVEIFFQRMRFLGLDSRIFKGLTIGVIGPATAEALRAYNINPDYMPPEYTGASFIENLPKFKVQNQRFLLPRASAADDEITMGIRQHGGIVTEIHAYDTLPDYTSAESVRRLLQGKQIHVVTFASSSTVTNLLNLLGKDALHLLEKVDIACIGPKTAKTALDSGLAVNILARESTIPGLVQAMEEYYSGKEAIDA